MQTTTVFTKHFTADGENARGRWVRNDFRTEDGQKFSTFDAAIASKAVVLLNQPVEVTYETPDPQYPNSHDLKDVEGCYAYPNGGGLDTTQSTKNISGAQGSFTPPAQIKPVDRNAGLARAIEFCGVTGEDLKEAYLDGSLFEMADVFAAYGALNQKPPVFKKSVDVLLGEPTV